jgi:hypothetical protein
MVGALSTSCSVLATPMCAFVPDVFLGLANPTYPSSMVASTLTFSLNDYINTLQSVYNDFYAPPSQWRPLVHLWFLVQLPHIRQPQHLRWPQLPYARDPQPWLFSLMLSNFDLGTKLPSCLSNLVGFHSNHGICDALPVIAAWDGTSLAYNLRLVWLS